MRSVNSLHCSKGFWVFVTLARALFNLFKVCVCVCLCPDKFVRKSCLCFALPTETYEDFNSLVIEVSVSLFC